MNQVSQNDIKLLAGSVGLIVDCCGKQDEVLGTAWLIDVDKVATCAHLIVRYDDCRDALKVVFPAAGQERGVARVMFHPRFNLRSSARMSRNTVSDAMPSMMVQKFNAAVLALKDPVPLSNDEKAKLNRKLSLPAPSHEHGLGGSLAEIDLSLVLQTITNGHKDGTLIISDDRNRPEARIFCQGGRILYATYKNLSNEPAIYQMFSGKISGNFFFHSTQKPDWPTTKAIARTTDSLLIESLRRADELNKLSIVLGGREVLFRHSVPASNLSDLTPEAQEPARILWPYIDGATPISQLSALAGLDDYSVYRCMLELLKTHQIENTPESGAGFTAQGGAGESLKMQPLNLAPKAPLSPWDEISNLTVDARSGRPQVKKGCLLGLIRPQDPYHLAHNLLLLKEATGSPLFKNGLVIGMHCGGLPNDPEVDQPSGKVQQMLWVEAIPDCLRQAGESELAGRITSTSIALDEPGLNPLDRLIESEPTGQEQPKPAAQPEPRPAGCRELARIACPKCGATSLFSARFCKLCGYKLMQDPEADKWQTARNASIAIAAALTICVMVVLAYRFLTQCRPLIVGSSAGTIRCVTIPEKPWLKIGVLGMSLKDKHPKTFVLDTSEAVTRNTGLVLDLHAQDPCFVYLLALGSSSQSASLIYPAASVEDEKLPADKHVYYPEAKTDEHGQQKTHPLQFEGPPGTETYIAIATRSRSQLAGHPDQAAAVFKTASQILAESGKPDGVEVDGDYFGENVFPRTTTLGQSDPVFITQISLRHKE